MNDNFSLKTMLTVVIYNINTYIFGMAVRHATRNFSGRGGLSQIVHKQGGGGSKNWDKPVLPGRHQSPPSALCACQFFENVWCKEKVKNSKVLY